MNKNAISLAVASVFATLLAVPAVQAAGTPIQQQKSDPVLQSAAPFSVLADRDDDDDDRNCRRHPRRCHDDDDDGDDD